MVAMDYAQNRLVVLLPQATPPVLHTCRESRSGGLIVFKTLELTHKLPGHRGEYPQLYLSPKFDMIILTDMPYVDIWEVRSLSMQHHVSEYCPKLVDLGVENIALRDTELQGLMMTNFPWGHYMKLDKIFNSGHLKTVTVLFGFNIEWMEYLKCQKKGYVLKVELGSDMEKLIEFFGGGDEEEGTEETEKTSEEKMEEESLRCMRNIAYNPLSLQLFLRCCQKGVPRMRQS